MGFSLMSKKQKNYQVNFHESDIEWLANEYKKRHSSDPSLALEDFALQYGVMAEQLGIYTHQQDDRYGNSVTLWHGTTASRAESILEEGFRSGKRSKHRIYFTKDPKFAQRHAKGRAKQEQDQPAIIMCSIDLSRYNNHEWQKREVLILNYDFIESEVVKRVNNIRS
jgi:hypothetical protein